jgi:hypothetical protein
MQKKEPTKFSTVSLALLVIAASVTISSFAEQSVLHILSPASGLVVHPGQTVAITVGADSSVQRLVLIGQDPIGTARPTAGGAAGILAQGRGETHPLQFLLTVPSAIRPGTYRVTAVGRTAVGPVQSEPLALDIERPDDPTRIWAEPSSIQFTHVGDQIPLRVLGAFPDGSQSELTRSSRTKFASADPNIASITPNGMVTAVGEGKTSILMQTPSADYAIPVRVRQTN